MVNGPAFEHVKVIKVNPKNQQKKELTELKDIQKLEQKLGTRLEVI